MIVYAGYTVQFHGLQFRSLAQCLELRRKIEEVCQALHPDRRFESDVEVEFDEHAGQEEE